jgi:hypothetical protein
VFRKTYCDSTACWWEIGGRFFTKCDKKVLYCIYLIFLRYERHFFLRIVHNLPPGFSSATCSGTVCFVKHFLVFLVKRCRLWKLKYLPQDTGGVRSQCVDATKDTASGWQRDQELIWYETPLAYHTGKFYHQNPWKKFYGALTLPSHQQEGGGYWIRTDNSRNSPTESVINL